jgi:hypothetical protein
VYKTNIINEFNPSWRDLYIDILVIYIRKALGDFLINNESIESIVKKDYKEAIVEYTLNAFEAEATEVSVDFDCNELHGVDEIRIIDTGTGIDRNTLDQTFNDLG